ncbi:MAG: glycosyltransferase family 1 protein [Sphingobacteriales bacterium]|nr:glycosyltransferase family 1 protein [Sphingobacteriales bacterium]
MINTKKTILFILHLPPPIHGASLISTFIKESKIINQTFNAEYINLTTASSLNDIGKKNYNKLITSIKLYYKTLKSLLTNKHDLTFLSITSHGPGFYKDLIVVVMLKYFNKNIIYLFNNKGVLENSYSFINNYLYKFVFKNTKSIVNSKFLRFDIDKYVFHDNIYVCANGIPLANREVEDNLEEKGERNLVKLLFLSNMMIEKGVYVLLAACEILHRNGCNFECHFVGDWSDITKKEFNSKKNEAGLGHCVFAHGKKYGEEKYHYLHDSDLFVFPTYYHNECFPLVLLEAMQFGLPIISTNEGGIRDIIEDGKTGYLVEKKDASSLAEKIEFLIKRPEIRRHMALLAKKRFTEEFTLRIFETNLIKILNEAMRLRKDINFNT